MRACSWYWGSQVRGRRTLRLESQSSTRPMMQPYPRSPDLVWPGHLHGTGCLSARAMDTGFPTVAWRSYLGLGCAWARVSQYQHTHSRQPQACVMGLNTAATLPPGQPTPSIRKGTALPSPSLRERGQPTSTTPHYSRGQTRYATQACQGQSPGLHLSQTLLTT